MASKLVLIPNATVIITSDPKASMHFEQYEKLILVEKGVELVIGWTQCHSSIYPISAPSNCSATFMLP